MSECVCVFKVIEFVCERRLIFVGFKWEVEWSRLVKSPRATNEWQLKQRAPKTWPRKANRVRALCARLWARATWPMSTGLGVGRTEEPLCSPSLGAKPALCPPSRMRVA